MCDIGTNYIKTIKATTLFVVFFFVHSWEQRKLSDIADRFDNLRIPVAANLRVHGSTPYYGANGIQDYVSGYTHNGEFVLVAEDGANDLKNYPVNYVKGRIWVNNHAHVLQGKARLLDNQFLSYLINRADIESLLVGCGRAKLNAETMMNIVLLVPKYEEQIEIGNYLSRIDNLITLHQRKVFSRFLQFLRQKKHSFLPISWEQRKLGNIAAKVTEKNTQNSIKETFTNSAEMGVVSQRDFFDHDIAKADKIDGYYIVQENDFIYNPRISVTAPCGPINRNKLGRKGVMSPLYTVFRTNDINPLFLEWYFKSSCWYAYMYFNGDSGARSDRFSIKNELFFDMPIPLPKEDEQRRIGLLLESLNNLITLHQRECFYIYKKYLLFLELQNSLQMNYSWEQRKAKELCSIGTGKSNTQDQVDDGQYPFYIRSDIPVKSNKYLYDCEAVITIGDGNIGKVFHYVNGKFDLHQRCYKMTDFQNIWGKYFFYYFSTKFYDRAMKMTAKATVDSVRLEMISEMDIKQPFQISEQKQIAEFFDYLNNLITLHQCESCKKAVAVQSAFARKNLSKWADSWEQRKFEDAFIERREKTVTENEDTLLSCAINGMFLNSELFGHFRGTTTIGYLKVKKHDLILSAQNLHLGNANVNLRFEHGIISPAYKVYDLNNCEPTFVQAWVKKDDTKNFFLAATTEGASQCRKNIEWDTLGKQTICMPSIKEQTTIGSFFKCVDNLITLHQCKVFSKNIIFKNIKFGGLGTENNTSWEQRKLGEVAIYRRGSFPQPYGKKEWYDGNGAMSFVQVADVTDEMNLVENTKQKISTLAQPMSVYADKNSVLVTLQGSIGRVAITQYGAFIDRTVLIFEKYKEPINILFWAYIIKQKFIEEAHKAPGGTIKTITKEALSDFDLLLPKYDEQSRVGAFFKQLDNLITLHQRIKIFITGDYHDQKNK